MTSLLPCRTSPAEPLQSSGAVWVEVAILVSRSLIVLLFCVNVKQDWNSHLGELTWRSTKGLINRNQNGVNYGVFHLICHHVCWRGKKSMFESCKKRDYKCSVLCSACCISGVISGVISKASTCGKSINYVKREPFSAGQWWRANQHGCTMRSRNFTFFE